MEIVYTSTRQVLCALCLAACTSKTLMITIPRGLDPDQKKVLETFTSYGTFKGLGLQSDLVEFSPQLKRRIEHTADMLLEYLQYYMLPLYLSPLTTTFVYRGPTYSTETDLQLVMESVWRSMQQFVQVKIQSFIHSNSAGIIECVVDSQLPALARLQHRQAPLQGYRLALLCHERYAELVADVQKLLASSFPVTTTLAVTKTPDDICSLYATGMRSPATASLSSFPCARYTLDTESLARKEYAGLQAFLAGVSLEPDAFDDLACRWIAPLLALKGGIVPVLLQDPIALTQELELIESLLDVTFIQQDSLLACNPDDEDLLFAD